jgi:hypothetical protein
MFKGMTVGKESIWQLLDGYLRTDLMGNLAWAGLIIANEGLGFAVFTGTQKSNWIGFRALGIESFFFLDLLLVVFHGKELW